MAYRTNRWALALILDQRLATADTTAAPMWDSRAAFARDAEVTPSTVADILAGRRDASAEVRARLADTLRVDERAISADPFDVTCPLHRVADAARRLAPHLNGHDFGLRAALAELDQAEAAA